ncbi:hypothetical protein EZJ43_05175 [Pedobacter changchengzhani]|uniref:Uncharacterized protein n=1 Tax=Pedobacter changchengzhani TaxID=2529274 RepID=A0A4R5MLZ8_9SPHI|nr:hypothetical protein [Pedobacter changchengzhani]TDG36678.1 hypothetical protein EZJ43_05175 [Pedobacter changchengzhani]
MKKLNLTTLVFALIILLSSACRKDDTLQSNQAKNAKDFASIFGAQNQSFKFNGNVENTFTLKGGTKITIPAGTFKVGGTAVNGEVVVSALEMLTRSAVVFSGTNTNHISGAPLKSDGFIYLNATAGGTAVDQVLTKAIRISIPTNRTGSTQIWEGVEKVGADNQLAWQAPVPNANGVQIKAEIDAVAANFTFDMGKLGWINCDVFYSYANPKTTVRVQLVNNPGNLASFRAFTGETFVFFCAKGSNVAAQLYTLDGANKVKSYDNMMPIGIQGKYISFSIKDGKYYYAELETTIVADQSISLNLTETTEAQVQNAINSLDGY